MYNVTDTYKTLIKDPVRYVGISGAVRLRSGEIVQINDSNIAAGSLSITSKLNGRGDFRPGGVYSSELSVGLTGVAVRTYDLDGAVIRLNYSIYPDNARKPAEAQTIPLGRFYADGSTIKRSGSVVNLKANDALMLFDIPAAERSGTLYELVTGACSSAVVSFGMTQEEFEALPNASAAVSVNTARIQTERDLLMYAGMMTGSFARITRTGELIFVPLSCEKDVSTHVIIPVREIAGNIRFQTDFSDDTTRIARLFMRRNGGAIYSTLTGITEGSEKLATLELEENPLMSEMSDDEVKAALNNLLAPLFECLNRVFNAEFTGDPALETGDYVRLRGGLIDTDRGYATGMITSQVWRYHGNHTIRCSMPSSLTYAAEETAAVMALAADDTAVSNAASPPERVQPKSQMEKRLDALGKAGSIEKLQTGDSKYYAVTKSKNEYGYDTEGLFLSNGETELQIYDDSSASGSGWRIQNKAANGITMKAFCSDNSKMFDIQGGGMMFRLQDSSLMLEMKYAKSTGGTDYRSIHLNGNQFDVYLNSNTYINLTNNGFKIYIDGIGFVEMNSNGFVVNGGANGFLEMKNGELFVGGKRVMTEDV